MAEQNQKIIVFTYLSLDHMQIASFIMSNQCLDQAQSNVFMQFHHIL